MKKYLLFCAVALITGGCGFLFFGDNLFLHEITIMQKNGQPCFSLVEDESINISKVRIHSLSVHGIIKKMDLINDIKEQSEVMMSKWFDDVISLQPAECISYEGSPLKNNMIYEVDFGVTVKKWPHENHSFWGAFCFYENKNGERVLHRFDGIYRPTSCPVSSDE